MKINQSEIALEIHSLVPSMAACFELALSAMSDWKDSQLLNFDYHCSEMKRTGLTFDYNGRYEWNIVDEIEMSARSGIQP